MKKLMLLKNIQSDENAILIEVDETLEPDTIYKEWGKKIKEVRQRDGWTYSDVVKELNFECKVIPFNEVWV